MATPGQTSAKQHLLAAFAALLVADPGAGKTAITLKAFSELLEATPGLRMLVVAPLRVCQLVWRQEGQKWSEFRHLRFSFIHGDKKVDRLKDAADIWLINPEGIQWLCDRFFGRALPFDVVTIDETTKFKNHAAKRVKALRKRLKGVRRRWGLTGTLIPNGYLDLFGQFLMLDDGAALGPFFTHYRDNYFQPDFDGFSYSLQPGGARRIEERIAPYVFRLPYTELPPLVDDPRFVDLSPAERKVYEQMKKDMVATLGDATVTAANSAAVYSKLKQLANGACYTGVTKGSEKEWVHVHDAKLDAIQDLIEELDGRPLLIGYEFRHDLERLQKRFPSLRTFDGATEAQAVEIERDWNNNKITLLAAHPASIGHGLNLQQGAANHIAWFSPTIDYELYDQFIRRLRRRGNDSDHVVNHLFLARNTVDDTLTLPAIQDKGITQDGLHARLAQAAGISAAETSAAQQTEHENMGFTRLSRQADDGAKTPAAPVKAAAPVNDAPKDRVQPKGWGKPAGEPAAANTPQEAIRDKIRQPAQVTEAVVEEDDPPPSTKARSMFSGAVQGQLAEGQSDAVEESADPAPTPAKRTRKKTEPSAGQTDALGNAEVASRSDQYHRMRAMEMAIQYSCARELPEDVTPIDVAQQILDFLEGKEQA